jgi:hypothetical protein
MQYDKSLVKILLSGFEEGKEMYTHHFEFIGCSFFKGKDNRPLLRKYLAYCKEKGYVQQHKYAHNIHRWSITQDGLEVLQLLNSDQFIK